MGYAHYTLADGREAGYGVSAQCDEPGCTTQIDRGLGYLCGPNPLGHKDDDEAGCGNYYCMDHHGTHECTEPECGYSDDESYYCSKVKGHDLPHVDDQGVDQPV